MRDVEEERFAGVTHFTQVDVQPGGINIQHVENLYQADILKGLGIELEVKRRKEDEAAEGFIPHKDEIDLATDGASKPTQQTHSHHHHG